MWVKLIDRPGQRQVVVVRRPWPWEKSRPLYLNVSLWQQLSQPGRDLLILRETCWLTGLPWFSPNVYQAAVVGAAAVAIAQGFQGEVVGALLASGLAGVAGTQVWRLARPELRELAIDRETLALAERRGYDRPVAAQALARAIEQVARLEERPRLTALETLRCQALQAVQANFSSP